MSKRKGEDTLTRCEVYNGSGYQNCPCWPADFLCGREDDDFEECDGTGWIDSVFADLD